MGMFIGYKHVYLTVAWLCVGKQVGQNFLNCCASHVSLQDWNSYRSAWGPKTSTWRKPTRQMIWSDLEGRRRRKQRQPGGVGLRKNGGRTCSNACL